MIYFDRIEQMKLTDKLYHALAPGGYLFLGQVENLHGLSEKFQPVHQDNGTAYKKV